jgi:hypothetical protein
MLVYLRDLHRTGGDPASMLFHDANALLKPYINRIRADFFKSADFSPDLVHPGERGQLRGKSLGALVF